MSFEKPFLKRFNELRYLRGAPHDVGFRPFVAFGDDVPQKLRRDIRLKAEDVGDDRAGLSGVEGDPDEKGDDARVAVAEVSGYRALNDRLENRAVLQVCPCLHALPYEGAAGLGQADLFGVRDPLELLLLYRLNP